MGWELWERVPGLGRGAEGQGRSAVSRWATLPLVCPGASVSRVTASVSQPLSLSLGSLPLPPALSGSGWQPLLFGYSCVSRSSSSSLTLQIGFWAFLGGCRELFQNKGC